MTVYWRRRGRMVFWRVGRLGGSFYLARASREDVEAKLERQRLRWLRRDAYRDALQSAAFYRRMWELSIHQIKESV